MEPCCDSLMWLLYTVGGLAWVCWVLPKALRLWAAWPRAPELGAPSKEPPPEPGPWEPANFCTACHQEIPWGRLNNGGCCPHCGRLSAADCCETYRRARRRIQVGEWVQVRTGVSALRYREGWEYRDGKPAPGEPTAEADEEPEPAVGEESESEPADPWRPTLAPESAFRSAVPPIACVVGGKLTDWCPECRRVHPVYDPCWRLPRPSWM